MYQKDFILRMIEMIADLIAGILGLIKKGDYQKASNSLKDAYQDYLKQDAAFFNNIPKDELTDKLLNEHNYTNGHLEMLSELFFAQAELSFAQGKNAESHEYYEKTLILTEYVKEETKTYSIDKELRIIHIKDRIAVIKGSK